MAKLKTALKEDLARMARCHIVAFPKALSSTMGQVYVEKMLEWYLVDDRAFIFLLEHENNCIGYCGGLKFDGKVKVGSASSMIQHSYSLALKTFLKRPWLLFHKEFISKYKLALKNVFNRIKKGMGFRDNRKYIPSNLPEPHTGLIVIGVDPAFQGKGYGTLMLQEFERISSGLGFNKMMLTVRSNNSQAIKSYQQNGWAIYKKEGKSVAMEKKLN